MTDDADKNRCKSCGYKWFPAGVDRATACPRCGSEEISYSWTERFPAYAGCLAISAFLLFVSYSAIRLALAYWR